MSCLSGSEREPELVSMDELRARGQVTEHLTAGNELYHGLGRPCPRCKSFFCSSHDFNAHQVVCDDADWKKSEFDDSYFCHVSKKPELVHACIVNGGVARNALYEYILSKNRQWLKRKKI